MSKSKGSLQEVLRSGYSVRVDPDTWHAPGRAQIQQWVAKHFSEKQYQATPDPDIPDTCSLFSHQHIVKDLIQPNSPYRGLLLYHGLGTGKSRSSIAIAEVLSTTAKVIVMLPASLAQNYVQEISQCGNEAYMKTGEWKFIKSTSKENGTARAEALAQGVSTQTIRKAGGVWVRRPASNTTASNFKDLTDNEKLQVATQIGDQIRSRYEFIHYNGSNLKTLLHKKSFDNCIVIIDEVHNFISMVVNGSKVIGALYAKLMAAQNLKLIALSGTPLINRPIEVAALANLVRGNIRQFSIVFKKNTTEETLRAFDEMLQANTRVDYHIVDRQENKITVFPLAEGFVWENKSEFLIKKDDTGDNKLQDVVSRFIKSKKSRAVIDETAVSTLFPSDEEDFDKLFINYEKVYKEKTSNPLVNSNLMARRLQGIVSYYEAYDPKLYPRVAPTPDIVKCHMSDHMFKTYMEARHDELVAESKSKKKNQSSKGNKLFTNTVFRAFSRAVCNFAFPQKIKRAFPSSMKSIKDELDDADATLLESEKDEEEEVVAKKPVKKMDAKNKRKQDYQIKLKQSMDALWQNRETYLKGEGLEEHGPKYAAILENLALLERPALIYSQFRNVEGLGIMKLVLEANGYSELKLKKVNNEWVLDMTAREWSKPTYAEFTDDKERNAVALAMFNNNFKALPSKLAKQIAKLSNVNEDALSNLRGEHVRIMMITQSGAEGISLKNVRQVHILEPFWNEIRVKQVIGRAVRANSHIDLPDEERQVNVYMYLTEFTEAQKRMEKTTEKNTSDEYVNDVATKKARITNELLKIVKSSAIDCLVHQKAHKKQMLECSVIPKNYGEPTGLLYSYRSIYDDPSDETLQKQLRQQTVARPIGYIKCKSTSRPNPIRIPFFRDTMEALQPQKFQEKKIEIIGWVMQDENGVPHLHRAEF